MRVLTFYIRLNHDLGGNAVYKIANSFYYNNFKLEMCHLRAGRTSRSLTTQSPR